MKCQSCTYLAIVFTFVLNYDSLSKCVLNVYIFAECECECEWMTWRWYPKAELSFADGSLRELWCTHLPDMTQFVGGGALLLLRRRLHDNPLLKSKKRIAHFTKKNLENILTDSLFRRNTSSQSKLWQDVSFSRTVDSCYAHCTAREKTEKCYIFFCNSIWILPFCYVVWWLFM